MKTELFYPRDWQGASSEQFIQALDAYIRWYNKAQIKISLGSLSPVDHRMSLGCWRRPHGEIGGRVIEDEARHCHETGAQPYNES